MKVTNLKPAQKLESTCYATSKKTFNRLSTDRHTLETSTDGKIEMSKQYDYTLNRDLSHSSRFSYEF